MVLAVYTAYIFHGGGEPDTDLIRLLEKLCSSFLKVKVLLEYDFYIDNEHLAFKLHYNLEKMRKNNPSIFLISRNFLNRAWCSQYKSDILEFMMEPKTLLFLMNDTSKKLLRTYSTQLLQKNITKISAGEIYTYTAETLEDCFIKHLLTIKKETPQGKYCVQAGKHVKDHVTCSMKELTEDFTRKNKIFESEEETRKRKFLEETKVEEKQKKTKKKNKKKRSNQIIDGSVTLAAR